MIARIWHGRTRIEDYDEYTEFMKSKAIPDYQKLGRELQIFSTNENVGHFTLITFWKNLDVIKNFAGENFEKAKYYAEDKIFLLEFEDKVIHYEVFAEE